MTFISVLALPWLFIRVVPFMYTFADTSNATDAETIPKEEESGVDAYLIGKCKKVSLLASAICLCLFMRDH